MIKYYKNFRLLDNSQFSIDDPYKISLELFFNGMITSTNISITKDEFDLLSNMLDHYNNLIKENIKNGK